MKKAEVRELLKVKASEGYITYSIMLEIYKDDEDIPDDMVNMLFTKPKEKNTVIWGGSRYHAMLDKMLGK
jgi:hypothetical protein